MEAWKFWEEELRGFPSGGGESWLWVVRQDGTEGARCLRLLVAQSWPGAASLVRARDRRGAAEEAAAALAPGPPLGRLLETIRTGTGVLAPMPGAAAAIAGATEQGGNASQPPCSQAKSGRAARARNGSRRAVKAPRPAGPAPRLLWVEPLGTLPEGGCAGAFALFFDDHPPWGEAVRLWGRRFAARVGCLLPGLPVCPQDDGAPLQLPLFGPAPRAVGRPAGLLLPRPVFLPRLPGAVGISRDLAACCADLPNVATSGVNVLLHGETGTGKEIIAQAIHRLSPRADRPFIGQNCAAMPEGLFESELFGHRSGAFTGAATDKMGLLEAADGGTFFLDEIGDMPLALQIKLLRVMQERRVRRIGELESRPVDLRFLAATHKDLRQEIAAGRFRQDLFYRLNVVALSIPPLRHRPEDIAHLLSYFLQRHGGGGPLPRLEERALAVLQAYRWPGNVRELENESRRLLALHPGASLIATEMLSPEVQSAAGWSIDPADLATLRGLEEATELLERYLIRKAIAAAGGRKAAAARRLGLSRQGLYKKIQRYGMNDLIGGQEATQEAKQAG